MRSQKCGKGCAVAVGSMERISVVTSGGLTCAASGITRVAVSTHVTFRNVYITPRMHVSGGARAPPELVPWLRKRDRLKRRNKVYDRRPNGGLLTRSVGVQLGQQV